MSIKILTNSVQETKKIGQIFGQEVLKNNLTNKAFIVGLKGDLGGGKTVFLQGFAKGLKIKERVLSPTFIISRKFLITKSKFINFYHIDCYRINNSSEILSLDFKKIISENQNIIALEWADKVRKFLPKNIVWLEFKYQGKNKREIIFN